jgi:uncharacterized PurR-regulated membrane protein YhhQ (DUF165 family)
MKLKKSTQDKILKSLRLALYFFGLLLISVITILFLAMSNILSRYQIDVWSAISLFIAIVLGNFFYDLLKNVYPKKHLKKRLKVCHLYNRIERGK